MSDSVPKRVKQNADRLGIIVTFGQILVGVGGNLLPPQPVNSTDI
ncbi:MAG: hypothetical protein ABI479_12315 [Gallionella sp.]